MCNVCGYPSKQNHLNWGECAGAWRERAGRMEEAAVQERSENAELRRRAEAARTALADLGMALASHLYITAGCDADRALRALEGR